MEKGDVVTITDGSYTRSVENGCLIHKYISDSCGLGVQYMVVEVNCIFPNTGSKGYCWPAKILPTYNNTVIQALSKKDNQPLSRGLVIFIEERFLELVPKPIREVTMAEVCAQFGENVKIKKD